MRNRWGVGTLSTKPGEVYVGVLARGGNKNVPVSVFDTPGSYAALSPQAQQKLYADATSVYGHDKVPTINMDSFLSQTAYNAYAVQQSTRLLVDPLNYWDYFRSTGGPGLDVQNRDAGGGGAGGGGGVSRSTNITRSVDLTSPTEARALVDNALEKYLGRMPTDNEYQRFQQALNRAEKKTPYTTKTMSVSSRGGGGTTSQSNVLSQNRLDRQQFTEEWARSQEGAAEYAAATTVLDAFIKALGE
jgi:hypothetical protein